MGTKNLKPSKIMKRGRINNEKDIGEMFEFSKSLPNGTPSFRPNPRKIVM